MIGVDLGGDGCIRAGWREGKAKDKEIRTLPSPPSLSVSRGVLPSLQRFSLRDFVGAGAAGQRIRRLNSAQP